MTRTMLTVLVSTAIALGSLAAPASADKAKPADKPKSNILVKHDDTAAGIIRNIRG